MIYPLEESSGGSCLDEVQPPDAGLRHLVTPGRRREFREALVETRIVVLITNIMSTFTLFRNPRQVRDMLR